MIQINPRWILAIAYRPYGTRDRVRVAISSLEIAASSPVRRDETVQIALLLAVVGGYLDAYTWIIPGVMANAQTASLVLLWLHGTAGHWGEAARFAPPIFAFAVGVVIVAWLRRAAGDRAAAVSTLIEIVPLFVVGILHNRLPDLAGTLGISFVAAVVALLIVLLRCKAQCGEGY